MVVKFYHSYSFPRNVRLPHRRIVTFLIIVPYKYFYLPIYRFISKTIQDTVIVTMEDEQKPVWGLSTPIYLATPILNFKVTHNITK